MIESEKERLNRLSDTFSSGDVYRSPENPLQSFINDACLRIFEPYLGEGPFLELGAAGGVFSSKISKLGRPFDTVDMSHKACENLKKRNLPDHRVYENLFEEFKPPCRYSAMFAAFVNEHVIDPQSIYTLAREALEPGGHLFVIVPNRNALSRRLAVAMGLLPKLDSLSEADLAYGHRRTYDFEDLTKEMAASGMEVVASGGLLMKPFADFQLNQLLDTGFLTKDHLEGLEKLGHAYPDLCMSIYGILKAGN